MIYLETTRVILREVTSNDAPLFLDLDSDPEVMKYLTDGKPSTPEEVKAVTERILAMQSRYQRRFGAWIAIEKSSGNFMGWFHFRPCKKDPDNIKSIEIGYRLKKQFWGKGYAPEVSKALIHKGFAELDVETVWAKTMEKNTNSRKVMEKAGLFFEETFLEDEFPGLDKSAVRYSLKR